VGIVLIVLVVIGLAIGAYYYFGKSATEKNKNTSTSVPFNPLTNKSDELKARDAQRKSNVRALVRALTLYKEKHSAKCPADLTALVAPENSTVTKLPTDPSTKANYAYKVEGTKCIVSATLENAEDEALKSDTIPSNGTVYDQATE